VGGVASSLNIEIRGSPDQGNGCIGGATGALPRTREWTVYARSTTIEAQPESIDAGIAYVSDEVMPALETMTGCIGLSLLVDRESGRCIATSAWDSEEAMRASADDTTPIRDRAAETFRGSASVAMWEIAVMHRDHRSANGACVRATWFKVPNGQMDRSVELYRDSVLPALEELEGFCSASLMVDRSSGRAVSSVVFDSSEVMDRNREQARSLRAARLRELGADQLDVGEFELTLAHLRVPEVV
jgi:heme-degrading monooxygenase HmoA